jgi:hypothetical protein
VAASDEREDARMHSAEAEQRAASSSPSIASITVIISFVINTDQKTRTINPKRVLRRRGRGGRNAADALKQARLILLSSQRAKDLRSHARAIILVMHHGMKAWY